jgi:hypothetical protein
MDKCSMSTSPVCLSKYYPTFAIIITNSLNSTYVSSDNLSLDFHFSLNLHPKTYCSLHFYSTCPWTPLTQKILTNLILPRNLQRAPNDPFWFSNLLNYAWCIILHNSKTRMKKMANLPCPLPFLKYFLAINGT